MRLTQVDENGRCAPWEVWVNSAQIVYMKEFEYNLDPHPGPSSTKKRKKAKGTRIYFLSPSIVVEERFSVVMAHLDAEY